MAASIERWGRLPWNPSPCLRDSSISNTHWVLSKIKAAFADSVRAVSADPDQASPLRPWTSQGWGLRRDTAPAATALCPDVTPSLPTHSTLSRLLGIGTARSELLRFGHIWARAHGQPAGVPRGASPAVLGAARCRAGGVLCGSGGSQSRRCSCRCGDYQRQGDPHDCMFIAGVLASGS